MLVSMTTTSFAECQNQEANNHTRNRPEICSWWGQKVITFSTRQRAKQQGRQRGRGQSCRAALLPTRPSQRALPQCPSTPVRVGGCHSWPWAMAWSYSWDLIRLPCCECQWDRTAVSQWNWILMKFPWFHHLLSLHQKMLYRESTSFPFILILIPILLFWVSLCILKKWFLFGTVNSLSETLSQFLSLSKIIHFVAPETTENSQLSYFFCLWAKLHGIFKTSNIEKITIS